MVYDRGRAIGTPLTPFWHFGTLAQCQRHSPSKLSNMAKLKFRPLLSETELIRLHSLVSANFLPTDKPLLHKLTKLKLEIESGLATPAYVEKESGGRAIGKDAINALGLDDNSSGPVSISELREIAYNKWLVNPHLLNDIETGMANEYRYENDLMSPEEENSYENSLFATSASTK